MFRRFIRECRGNVAVAFAFSLVPIIGLAGGAVDMTRWNDAGQVLQSAADAGALGAARLRRRARSIASRWPSR